MAQTYALETRIALLGLGAGEVAQAVVLALRLVIVARMQGCQSQLGTHLSG